MNVCENEAVIAFDTLYTQNHIQILKILLPYFDPYGQNHLAVWIKYLELRYTLEYVSRHPSPPYKNQTSGTSSPDFAVLFEQIKNFCSPQEKALFGELLNLQKNLEMFEEMKGMMQLFETLRESAPDADADTAADAELFRHESGCRLYESSCKSRQRNRYCRRAGNVRFRFRVSIFDSNNYFSRQFRPHDIFKGHALTGTAGDVRGVPRWALNTAFSRIFSKRRFL